MAGLVKVSQSRAHANAIAVVQRVGTDARGLRVVDIRELRESFRQTRIIEGLSVREHLLPLESAHGNRAVGAVEVPTEIRIRLQLSEIREDTGEGPLIVAPLRPAVEVLWCPS